MKEFNINKYSKTEINPRQKVVISNFIKQLENGEDYQVPVGLQSFILVVLLKVISNIDKDTLIQELKGFFNE